MHPTHMYTCHFDGCINLLSLETTWRITSMEFGMSNCFIFFVFWHKFIAFQADTMTNRTEIRKQRTTNILKIQRKTIKQPQQMILEWLMAKFIFRSVNFGWLKIVITFGRSQRQPKTATSGKRIQWISIIRLFDDSAKCVALSRIDNWRY